MVLRRWAEFVDFVRMRSYYGIDGMKLYAASHDRSCVNVIKTLYHVQKNSRSWE